MYGVGVSNGLYKLWGRNMMRYREAAELSRKEVALKLGVVPPTISRWEAGIVMPNEETKLDIAELYGVLPSTIFPLKRIGASS